MNIFLWILQGALAVHTLAGAIWKFKNNAEQTMPSLKAISPNVWMGLGGFEILLALGLIIPIFYKPWSSLVPISAIAIALVMLVYCVLHLTSGAKEYGPMIYWLVVAVLCGLLAYGRFTQVVTT